MPKFLTNPINISLDGSNKKHVILPLPPESPRHKGKFIVERHPGDPRRELICWEPRKAKHMTPLEAAATVLQRMSEAARSEKSMDLKAVFQKYDADGGGSIDQEELGLVLKEFHILLDEEELSEVFSIFDPDGGGEISYLEFVYAIFNRRAFIRKLETGMKNENANQSSKSRHFVSSNEEEQQSNEAYAYFKRTAERKERAAKNAADALKRKELEEQAIKESLKSKHSFANKYTSSSSDNDKRKTHRAPKAQRVKMRGVLDLVINHADLKPVENYRRFQKHLIYTDAVKCIHKLIFDFMTRHKLKIGDLFKYADSSRTRKEIMSDYYGEIDVNEFITLIRHCEKEEQDLTNKLEREKERKQQQNGVRTNKFFKNAAAVYKQKKKENRERLMKRKESSSISLITNAAIAKCFHNMSQGDGTIDISELDEFVRKYRQQIGTTKIAERTHQASIPLLQLGYRGVEQPHQSPRTFQQSNGVHPAQITPRRPSGQRSSSSPMPPSTSQNISRSSPQNTRKRNTIYSPSGGTYTVRQGRLTTTVTLSNSPRRTRASVDVNEVKVGKTCHIVKNDVDSIMRGMGDDTYKTEAEILAVLENWMDLHVLRVKDAFSAMDINNSGGLSPEEFMQVFLNLGCTSISKAQMMHLFESVDEDKSGDITLPELRRHIRRRRKIALEEGLSKVAERIILKGGTSFPTVYFDDFEKYTPIEASDLVLKKIVQAVQNNKDMNLKAIFKKYDTDGGGSIDMNEFTQVLLEFKIKLTKSEVDNVFRIFDPDGGGEISYLELVYAVKNRADFIRRLNKAENIRLKKQELNDQKFWGDPTKIKGEVEMNRDELNEDAIEFMRKTSEHTDGLE
jgi:Ca2+-binding EF-hand superfamily protein